MAETTDSEVGVAARSSEIARPERNRAVWKMAALAGMLLLIWSGLFLSTYRYPFYWDDYHQIRPYSWDELLSTWHGWSDPDKLETPAFRPLATLLFALQGSMFGEHVVFQKVFMTVLMGLLLFVLGLLLLELRFGLFQITTVFTLFVFSRVFASLNMWVTLGTLILCYIFMVLTGYFFLLWLKRSHILYAFLMFISAAAALLVREEAYVLPFAMLLLWGVSPRRRRTRRRMLFAALGVLAMAGLHFYLRSIFVPETHLDPHLDITILKFKVLLVALASSWLPGGFTTIGIADNVLEALWISFLIGSFVIAAMLSRGRWRWRIIATGLLGCVLSLPAIGAPRSFGIAMPSLAFMTAIVMALTETWRQLSSANGHRKWRQYAFVTYAIFGLTIALTGGIRRSMYVAESLHPNCLPRIETDAPLIFNMRERYAPVPDERIESARARLKTLGIYNIRDLLWLHYDSREHPERYEQRRETHQPLFLPKYDYLSY